MRFGLTLNAVAGCLFVGLIGFKADEGGGHWQAPQLAVDKYGEIYAPDWGIVPDGQDHSAQLASLISAMGQSQQGVKGAGASMAVTVPVSW